MKNIVIIGAGPAGATAATLLAREGHQVYLFHTPKRPEIIVGESLLPAVIPFLKKLGVEQKVRDFSTFKPGATIVMDNETIASFNFDLAHTSNTYAYNVPRDKFDAAIFEAAIDAGAHFIQHRCSLNRVGKSHKVELDNESLSAIGGDMTMDEIDLIVDASGRQRLIPKLFQLPSVAGGRQDLALFAHLEGVNLISQGNIHVDRLDYGWGWRIPLPGKVSVGAVVSPEHLKQYGQNREEQYDNFIRDQSVWKNSMKQAERTSSVLTYSNYQWKSEILHNENWVLIGDSAGFIDPVFSTGLFLAMDSAVKFVDSFNKNEGNPSDFEEYQNDWINALDTWKTIIDSWYDGKLLSLFKMGQIPRHNIIGKWINRHMTKHVTRIFTGEIHPGSYSHKLLAFMMRHGIRGVNPEDTRIF